MCFSFFACLTQWSSTSLIGSLPHADLEWLVPAELMRESPPMIFASCCSPARAAPSPELKDRLPRFGPPLDSRLRLTRSAILKQRAVSSGAFVMCMLSTLQRFSSSSAERCSDAARAANTVQVAPAFCTCLRLLELILSGMFCSDLCSLHPGSRIIQQVLR